MCGNGRRVISVPIPDFRASPTRSTPKPSSEPSIRCCEAGRGQHGPVPSGQRSATGITASGARFSAAFGVPAMTESSINRWFRTARQERHEPVAVAYKHANPRMLAEVAAGLSAPQKELPPKYFYDHRGSELFEEITRLPEYYQTRTERALLEVWMPALVPELGTRSLIELGAGSAEKSRIILSAMRSNGTTGFYVPIDVSASFLTQTATRLRHDYPGLSVEPIVADITEDFSAPQVMPRPTLFAFLGGTIGNFYPPAAIRLLSRLRMAMSASDRFLMGVDLRKDVGRIEAAYNDSQGVTAAFNRNMLLVLNHELGSEFDPDSFA